MAAIRATVGTGAVHTIKIVRRNTPKVVVFVRDQPSKLPSAKDCRATSCDESQRKLATPAPAPVRLASTSSPNAVVPTRTAPAVATPPALRSGFRIVHRDQCQQPVPRNHRIHLRQELLAPRPFLLHRIAEAGKGGLFRQGSLRGCPTLPDHARSRRFFGRSLASSSKHARPHGLVLRPVAQSKNFLQK